MNTHEDFISEISPIPAIPLILSETYDLWGKDIPIIVLFSNIGKGVARSFEQLSNEEQALFFESIEKGMSSPNEGLRVAVATGLLEALCTTAQDSSATLLWPEIHTLLRPKSRAYLDAWLNWQS